ncbi:hypothetical protein BJY04DRAFT_219661 [Aspergillus karnatakaensis]|uniref:CCCH zinc finger DNA binding protein n=1 Tax=Aspergillus karnatakaensis TaxID=1810916 RepID=UPI003CCD2B0F
MVDIAAVAQRYTNLCSLDDNKDKIIADLFDYVEALETDLETRGDELSDQKRIINSFRTENDKLKVELSDNSRRVGKLSYISVLVDGDGMNFQEELVRKGKEGGHEAARALIQAAEKHVRNVNPEISPLAYVKIRVYANVHGLTRAYIEAGVLAIDQSLAAFIHGFNQADEWCDFIDVGSGKECSDVKVKAAFTYDLVDIHCQRVVLCASADNGYAHLLRQHQCSDRISLVEGPPFAAELKHLATGLQTTAFTHVFRSAKLKPEARLSAARNYASAAKTTPPASIETTREPTDNNAKPVLKVYVNTADQRIDERLKISLKDAVNGLKQRKLCNKYHILASCHHQDCAHGHGPRLAGQQLIDLIYIARSTPCPAGPDCRDPECIAGHRCVYGEGCMKKECKFSDEMHHDNIYGPFKVCKSQFV